MTNETKRMTSDELAAVKATTMALTPDVRPYITDKGGIVVLSGPYPRDKAQMISDAIKAASMAVPALLAHIEALEALALRPVQYRNGVDGRDGVDIEFGELVFVLNDAGQTIVARCYGSLWGEPEDRDAWRVKYWPLDSYYAGVAKRAPFQRCYRLPSAALLSDDDLRRERDVTHG